MDRRTLMKFLAPLCAATMLALPASADDAVSFATNWKAQGGHGGFYQAVADGTYKQFGLDVTIVQGGPQVNVRSLLAAGKVDFLLGSTPLTNFESIREGVPTIIIAAFYQKDPQALMAHPGRYSGLADMKNAPTVIVNQVATFTWYPWLKLRFGFTDEQVKNYNYSLAPFLSDPDAVQQGYATAEPLYITEFKPDVFMLADNGWEAYANTIETQRATVENNPDLVQRFIDASIIGWNNFLFGDRSAAYALMMADNPEVTREMLDTEVNALLELGLPYGGEAGTRGIGALDMERMQRFRDDMVEVGLYKEGEIDMSLLATDRFVNKGVGLDVRDRLMKK